jgi:hypothetical protein
VEIALQAGVPAKVHILNLLHRLVDDKPIETPIVDAPQALTRRAACSGSSSAGAAANRLVCTRTRKRVPRSCAR